MKDVFVQDNFFDKEFLYEAYNVVNDISIKPNNIANRITWPYGNKGTHNLFGKTLFDRKSLNTITLLDDSCSILFNVFEAIEQRILKNAVLLNQISLNLQVYGMDGTTHTDSIGQNDRTIIWMVNPEWENNWGGEFQITTSDGIVVDSFDYVPGRIIILPSNIPHRGLAPLLKYIFRYTIVFRISSLEHKTHNNFLIYGDD